MPNISTRNPGKDFLFVVGTRPEFIKIRSVLLEVIRQKLPYRLIHTGQHYDYNMSEIFFKELGLPKPDTFLEIGSAFPGSQTGEGLRKLEELVIARRPKAVVVQGDTNTTLFGALAAIKWGIPVAHVEAGVRSFDMTMPEEINRRMVDSISSFCFAPTRRALGNLRHEGRIRESHLAGDTLVETAGRIQEIALARSAILDHLKLTPKTYIVITSHRQENVDSPDRSRELAKALLELDLPVVYPIHPRSRKMFSRFGILKKLQQKIILTEPLGYFDFITLQSHAKLVMTDSGGVQQEASIFHVPCLTLRQNTEWVETIEAGKNRLVGMNSKRILKEAEDILTHPKVYNRMVRAPSPFKEGAAVRIVKILRQGRIELPRSDFLKEGLPPSWN